MATFILAMPLIFIEFLIRDWRNSYRNLITSWYVMLLILKYMEK